MYAVLDIGGQQLIVEPNKQYFVNRLDGNEGDIIEFKHVMLLKKDDDIRVGKPIVEGVTVKAKILEHLKDKKIYVFKKKRRKGYKKLRGHRQYLTKISIEAFEIA